MFFTKPDLTFTIDHDTRDLEHPCYRVWFQRGNDPIEVFLPDVIHISTVCQMIAEGLRRLEGLGSTLIVRDTTGIWEYWLDHNRAGVYHPKRNIPTHSISD